MIENFRIDLRDISKHFGKIPVLEHTSLSLASRDFIVITGANGAGKTTLLRIVAGLEKPDRCDISLDGGKAESWSRLRKHLLRAVMYLHQQPYMLAGSLRRNIEYAARLNRAIVERESAVSKAIQWAGLEALASQAAASLSGGQRQRVALARARLRNPQILLLDEPTANLDRGSRGRTLQMLKEFSDSGTAIVIVSHDPGIFDELATTRLQIRDHEIRSAAPKIAAVVNFDRMRKIHQR